MVATTSWRLVACSSASSFAGQLGLAAGTTAAGLVDDPAAQRREVLRGRGRGDHAQRRARKGRTLIGRPCPLWRSRCRSPSTGTGRSMRRFRLDAFGIAFCLNLGRVCSRITLPANGSVTLEAIAHFDPDHPLARRDDEHQPSFALVAYAPAASEFHAIFVDVRPPSDGTVTTTYCGPTSLSSAADLAVSASSSLGVNRSAWSTTRPVRTGKAGSAETTATGGGGERSQAAPPSSSRGRTNALTAASAAGVGVEVHRRSDVRVRGGRLEVAIGLAP